MSIGGDEYDEQGRTGGAGTSIRRGPTRGTRTRLPGEDGDVHGVGRRPPGRPGRSLLMVVSVVVLLIAAIAFANRSEPSGSGGEEADGPSGGAQPTAPTGRMPVQGKDGTTGIPTGFPQTRQGAQSAAANYAVALGGDQMFKDSARSAIVHAVYVPEIAGERLQELNRVYNDPRFLRRIGLKEDGTAPNGLTFISRTNPVGAKTIEYSGGDARVAVWYSALFGLAGPGSENPVAESWYTNTFDLRWVDGAWRIRDFEQKDGPAPVRGDQRASSADDMADAVDEFGGFTYAR